MLFDVITGFNPVIYPLAARHNLWIAGSSPAMTVARVAPSLREPQAEAIQLRGIAFKAGSRRFARDDAE